MFDIVSRIPPRARRVVQLGCERGEAGEAFLRIQPDADYWGFETKPEAVREASDRIQHALLAQPEELDFAKAGLYQADAMIIGGDYLRGMTAERLKQWTGILSEDGTLLLLLRNAGYLRNILTQLAARQP